MASKFLCLALLVAGACASPVRRSVGKDYHFDLPDINNLTVGDFVISAHGGYVDVKNLTLKLDPTNPGTADAIIGVIELEVPNYTANGGVSIVQIEGDGSISIKINQDMKIGYQPVNGSTTCAKLHEKLQYTWNVTKIEADITGLKADYIIDIGKLVDKFLEEQDSFWSEFLTIAMNDALFVVTDPLLEVEINSICTSWTPVTTPSTTAASTTLPTTAASTTLTTTAASKTSAPTTFSFSTTPTVTTPASTTPSTLPWTRSTA